MQHNYFEVIFNYIENIWSKCLMFIRTEHMHFFFLLCTWICIFFTHIFPSLDLSGLTCVIIFFGLQMYNIYYNLMKEIFGEEK